MAAPLKNHKNSSHKYGGISPLFGNKTVAMVAVADLERHNNQYDWPLVEIKKEEIFPFSGGGIAEMEAAAALKSQKNQQD